MKTKELTKTELNNIYNNMYNRCYNDRVHELKPWYKDCTMCDEWLNDKYAFYDWVNDGNFYTIEGQKAVELDHDILVKGNKVYSPETAIFCPKPINAFFGGLRKKKDNDLPLGVTQMKNGLYKPQIAGYRGAFNTIEEAFEIYKMHKEAKIMVMADEYVKRIPYRLYEAMLNWKIEITD